MVSDDKIISMYARGMSTREIQGHLEDMYRVGISPTLISNVTQAVMDKVKAWQNRSLDAIYPILYLDAIFVKAKDDGHIRNKAVYIAVAVNMEGHKDVLGIYLAETQGVNFWLAVSTDLQNRGVNDILIAGIDGLKGFPEATIFPGIEIQYGARNIRCLSVPGKKTETTYRLISNIRKI